MGEVGKSLATRRLAGTSTVATLRWKWSPCPGLERKKVELAQMVAEQKLEQAELAEEPALASRCEAVAEVLALA